MPVPVVELLGPKASVSAASPMRRAIRALAQRPLAITGLAVLVVLIVCAILAPLLAPHDPYDQVLAHRLSPPFWEPRGSTDYLLGTDGVGRDVLSRLIFGARISLALGFTCSILSSILGVGLGLLAGLRGGRLGAAIMRVADVQIAFPFLVLAIAVIAVFGANFVTLVVILSVFGWVQFARLVRGDVLAVKEKDYVEAARAVGASELHVALRHVLPNVLSPVIVIWTFTLAQVIIVESALSFLGFGVQPPTPSWGSMLSDGRNYLDTAWWLGIFPGLAIMLAVLAVNFLGDALRDVLDPRANP